MAVRRVAKQGSPRRPLPGKKLERHPPEAGHPAKDAALNSLSRKLFGVRRFWTPVSPPGRRCACPTIFLLSHHGESSTCVHAAAHLRPDSFLFLPAKVVDGKIKAHRLRWSMSTLTRTLIEEIKSAPETVQQEVFDFLVFLKARQTARTEGREDLLPLAQTAWGADWDTPQEDEAWRDL